MKNDSITELRARAEALRDARTECKGWRRHARTGEALPCPHHGPSPVKTHSFFTHPKEVHTVAKALLLALDFIKEHVEEGFIEDEWLQTQLAALVKEKAEPFCSDHRSKVKGRPCYKCALDKRDQRILGMRRGLKALHEGGSKYAYHLLRTDDVAAKS